MIYVSGPGHGGPAVVGNTYLEGTYSEVYPNISQDEAGLRNSFFNFRFRRNSQPRLTGNTGFNSRGWGVGLFRLAIPRRGFR